MAVIIYGLFNYSPSNTLRNGLQIPSELNQQQHASAEEATQANDNQCPHAMWFIELRRE